jgi:hypothetical protein
MAIDLFLGIRPNTSSNRPRRGGYRDWYSPEHVGQAYVLEECKDGIRQFAEESSRFWSEYYRPMLSTYFHKHFAYLMNSSLKLPGFAELFSVLRVVLTFGVYLRKASTDASRAHSPFHPHNQPAAHRPK